MKHLHYYLENYKKNYEKEAQIIYREGNKYLNLDNNEIYNKTQSIVNYLMPKYKDKNIAIIGNTKMEWILSFFAVFGYVGNAILVDREANNEEIKYIFSRIKPDIIILDDEIEIKYKSCPIVSFSEIENISNQRTKYKLDNTHEGNIYFHTSGTTGIPKIVKLNRNNLKNVVRELNERWEVTDKDSCLLIIPLYHIYAILTVLHAVYARCTMILEHDFKQLDNVLRINKPTIFVGVPLIFNKIRKKILEKNRTIILMMIYFSKTCLKFNIDIRKKIFKKIHEYFGGNYILGTSAGGFLSAETNEFFNNIGLPLYNAYGMTETSGPIAINYRINNRIGSVRKDIKC